MFEKYSDGQKVPVKILTNAIMYNKLSHAYIFETNNYKYAYEFVLEFIKYIVCPNILTDNHDVNCGICTSIDNNNYVELKIINPETIQIKKEDMINLQKEFKNKAVYGNKKIYLIKNAEKLNSASSNTILKFLEEPEENIIAILMTNSRYNLLNTIISRCQTISLNEVNSGHDNILDKLYNDFYSSISFEDIKEKLTQNIEKVIKFIDFYEKHKIDSLLFTHDNFLCDFSNREECLVAFEIIKLFYYDAIKYKISNNVQYFNDYENYIKELADQNDINLLSEKLEIILKSIEKIKYNVNISLLVDKFIMEIGGK